MNLNIYTKKPNNYFSKEFLKETGRFLFKKSRGPQAVNDGLVRGLKELNEVFFINQKNPKLDGTETFFINSSICALKWSIKLKKEGKIKKLIAGPNLVFLPSDYENIISSSQIDKIILPSDWVKRVWVENGFNESEKTFIWPSGVADEGVSNHLKEKKVLLYKKYIPNDIYLMVKKTLTSLNIDYEEIFYGKFFREDYFKKLDTSSCLIYLQESETQGLSLLEAWMKNIPTFVYNYGKWQRDGVVYYGDDISSPYLNLSCGSFFKSEEDLKRLLIDIKNGNDKYNPREYYLNNFTDKICTEKFLEIVNAD